MRKKLMTGIALMALPAMFVSTASYGADEGADAAPDQTIASVPPAPQGPFFSRGMAPESGAFPPMGFDPMKPGTADGQVAQNIPPVPVHPGNRMNNAAGAGTGGGTDVDIEIRGRIGLSGRGTGAGNQGWGANNFMRNMPYGMPYRHGYGAPYGTPFNQGYGAPLPAAPQVPAPEVSAVPGPMEGPSKPPAPKPTPTPTPTPSSAQTQPQPFTWAPQQGMQGGNLNPQPPAQAAAPAPAPTPAQPQAQPQQPAEPDWVTKQRAEAEKRRIEAQKRFSEMQKNNPYAGQGYAQPGYPQQGFARGFGQPFNHGYGAPYGAPFMPQPFGYAPQAQPQAPATSGQGN